MERNIEIINRTVLDAETLHKKMEDILKCNVFTDTDRTVLEMASAFLYRSAIKQKYEQQAANNIKNDLRP